MKSLRPASFLVFPVFALLLLGRLAAAGQDDEKATADYAAAAKLQQIKAYDLAAEQWLKFLGQHPSDPRAGDAAYNLGVCYYLDGKLDRAAAAFAGFIEKNPKSEKLEPAHLYLGLSRYGMAQQGQAEMARDAVAAFSTLLTKYPQSRFLAEAQFYRGEALYLSGNKAEAATCYEQLVQKSPRHELAPKALHALGMCRQELQQWDEATKAYETFLRSFANHPLAVEVTMRLGEVFLEKGQLDQAIERLRAATAANGFELADYAGVRLGDALAANKQYSEAAKAYQSVVERFRESSYTSRAALAAGECHYLAGSYDQARAVLLPLLKAEPPMAADAAHWIARSWLEQSKPDQALAVAEQALAGAGQGEQAATLMVDRADAVYAIPERRKQSIALYAEAADKFPEHPAAPQARYLAASTALELHQFDQAAEQCGKFLAAYPQHALVADVLFATAESRLFLRQFAEAEKAYADLVSRFPQHANLSLWKVRQAWVLLLQKKYDQTIQAVGAVVDQLAKPELLAEARYLLGRSQFALKRYDEAVKQLEASLQASEQWREADQAMLILGQAYLEAGQAAKAQTLLAQLLERFPESDSADDACYWLGEAFYRAGEAAKAVEQFRRLLDTWQESPLRAAALFQLGCALLDQQQYAPAQQAFDTLVSKHGNDPLAQQARFSRAVAHYRQGKFTEAVADLKPYLNLGLPKKEKSEARFLLGVCQVELKQYDAAIDTFRTLLADDPEYSGQANTLYQLGWALSFAGKRNEAKDAFIDMIRRFPESPLAAEAYYHVGQFLYEAKDYAQAAIAYHRAFKQAEGNNELKEKAIYKLGWCYYHQDQLDNALATFRAQTSGFPQGTLAADALFMTGECLLKQENYAAAAQQFAQVTGRLDDLSSEEFRILALLHAGQAASQLKQWPTALGLLQQCVSRDPHSPHAAAALYEQGWVQQQSGKLDEAVKLYEKVVGMTDDETAARAQFMIGEVQFVQKKHEEAVRSFFKVMYGYGYPNWQAEATYEAARCFDVMQRADQATRLYQELIDRFPQNPKVEVAKRRVQELKGSP